MVPRAYQYQSAKPTYTSGVKEKDEVAVEIRERSPKMKKRKNKAPSDGMPAWLSSPAAATPSRPVIIPTRVRDGGMRRSREGSTKCRRPSYDLSHKPESISSSAAVLHAMTSVPAPKVQHASNREFRYTSKIRRKEDTSQERSGSSMSTSSPQSWDVLLSPPSELDLEYSSFGSDTTVGAESLNRSFSIDSMPSLDDDCGSLTSPSDSIPSTPGLSFRSRNGYERKLSLSKVEDCVLDHPLLPLPSIQQAAKEEEEPEATVASGRRSLARSTSALKSNLSASIALVRSAARSFKNFTAPTIAHNEHLTRSLLSINPPFTDERRPPPTNGPPDPALRRYLNPINVSPSELHIHHDQPHSLSSHERCTTSIQLQSYKRVPRPSDKASAPPIFASKEKANAAIMNAAEEPFSTPCPKQREPRENSDFLRVIVLEMNMRRSGQLRDGMPGKARMALPARQANKRGVAEAEKQGVIERGVPHRWVAVRAY